MPRKKLQSSEEEEASVSSSVSDESQSESASDSESPEPKAKSKAKAPTRKAPARKAAGKGGRKGTKRKRDPNAPKKKQSAYMFFLAKNRERIKAENPGISFGEIGREAGKEWNGLSEAEKEPYNQLSEKDKERYEKEMKSYTPAEDSDDEPPKKKTKGKKDPNAPKAPINAYFYYVREKREEYKSKHPDLKVTEITRALGGKWKEMSEAEKAPFQKLADADKDRYKKEMANYNL